MRNDDPALRIFACVKHRQDGRPACGNSGSADLITALRLELARRGLEAAHIDVRPCGCLDQCDKGPVLVAFTGSVAESPVPPQNFLEKLLQHPKIRFENVTAKDAPEIVEKLLALGE